MKVEWQLPARMFVEQLSSRTQATLRDNIEILAKRWERHAPSEKPSSLKVLTTKNRSGSPIYSFGVGTDLRVILTLRGDTIIVLDLVRNSQINKLRSIIRDQA